MESRTIELELGETDGIPDERRKRLRKKRTEETEATAVPAAQGNPGTPLETTLTMAESIKDFEEAAGWTAVLNGDDIIEWRPSHGDDDMDWRGDKDWRDMDWRRTARRKSSMPIACPASISSSSSSYSTGSSTGFQFKGRDDGPRN